MEKIQTLAIKEAVNQLGFLWVKCSILTTQT